MGLLERVPQNINERPPHYRGRDDLETLMASPNCGDWIKIRYLSLAIVTRKFKIYVIIPDNLKEIV